MYIHTCFNYSNILSVRVPKIIEFVHWSFCDDIKKKKNLFKQSFMFKMHGIQSTSKDNCIFYNYTVILFFIYFKTKLYARD